jgi:hypothetical protein
VAARGSPVFRVDPASSLVVILVRRGGSLARLGHDHVVASHDVQGLVAPGEGRSDLYVALDRLVVDEPALRAEAKLDTQPTEEDIAGTRRNMLNTLQANEFPFALVNIARGGLIDHDALRVALDSGHVARASLDTVEPEPLPAGHWIYSHPGIRMSPHISWSMPHAQGKLVDQFRENLRRYLDEKPPHHGD